jgi:hypothetical protein
MRNTLSLHLPVLNLKPILKETHMQNADITVDLDIDFDFEILETTEATAMEEMGASSTICAGSTCSKQAALMARGC